MYKKQQKHKKPNKKESDLVDKHKGLVISLAYKFAKKSKNYNDVDDYIQVGYIGLLKAIRNYKGINSLATMAWKYINWEILNYISKSKKPLRHEFNNTDVDHREKKNNIFAEYIPTLNHEECNILHLRLSGYTFIEIGNIIGYSRYTARNRYMSVIDKIKRAS